MPSIKDLRKRIGSVKNTQQTTKAMKMVSAAKLRRAQEAITAQRPYAKQIGSLIRLVSMISEGKAQSPLVRRDPTTLVQGAEGQAQGRKVLLVVVTSDRGLCGGFNANVIKAAQRWLAGEGASCASVRLAFVGKRGFDFYKTKKVELGTYFSELGGKVTFLKAKKLADSLLESYLSGEVNEVKFVYNEFKNAVTQRVLVEDFLPIESAGDTEGGLAAPVSMPTYIVKPDLHGLLDALLSKHFATQCFRVMLESQAGEHGARMSSMENATKNAGEMMRKLTLQYNKQRQAGITKELLEIISGAESQKSAS